MKMPKMEEGKTVENGKWHQRQKCRNKICVLVKNAENYVLETETELFLSKEVV